MDTTAKVMGKRAPRGNIPTGLLKAIAPAGPVIGKVMGQPPNMRELISSADGVTFWATQDKAEAELGFSPVAARARPARRRSRPRGKL